MPILSLYWFCMLLLFNWIVCACVLSRPATWPQCQGICAPHFLKHYPNGDAHQPMSRLGERVLSCGFFPAEYEIGFLLGPSNDAKFSSLLTLHLLRGQAFPSYLYVGFLSRYNGSSPGVGSGGSHKFSLVGGFDTYSSSSSSEFLHMMELVSLFYRFVSIVTINHFKLFTLVFFYSCLLFYLFARHSIF